LDGPSLKYFEGGQLKYKGQYINGKLEGKVTYYYASGKIDAEGVYKNDLKDGEWKYFTEDGKVKRADKYVNGYIVGGDKNIITKEQQDKEKKQFEQFELKDPYSEEYKGE
jgi:antitoxin component YwqK of YwqJK toxin-antitoxin module